MILYSEGATKAQESEAEGIIAVLTAAYPNYPWAVRVYDGGFFIRNLDYPEGWGMNFKYKDVGYSASYMKRQIILMAGEWLERANLIRGYNNEDEIQVIEGLPDKYQPVNKTPLILKELGEPNPDAKLIVPQEGVRL